MAEPCLTVIEAASIQPYIFSSNRLQENIGASEQVYRSTTMWAWQALEETLTEKGQKHNVKYPDAVDWELFDPDGTGTDAGPQAEVVYAGGGKTLILFRDGRKVAKKFVCRLTTRALREAPGLTLTAQHIEFSWQTFHIKDLHEKLLRKLAEHKQARQPSLPLLGLGVTVACESTGLVADRSNDGTIEIEDKKAIQFKLKKEETTRLLSRETAYKLGWRDFAKDRLEKELGKYKHEYPADIDNLGRQEGEESYVAVVHADTNKMGKHLEKLAEGAAQHEYIKKLRHFSETVRKAGREALKTVIKVLDSKIKWDESSKRYLVAEEVPLTDNTYLPFRPLVFGGDDVTFLCNARLGLSLAVMYLQAFEEKTSALFANELKAGKMKPLYACAGIAMVKMHYPFARAYSLSEQLCNSAKSYVRSDGDRSALDWHFATGGLSGSLGAIREREFTTKAGKLNMRPVALRKQLTDQDGRYWLGEGQTDDKKKKSGYVDVLAEFQADEKWAERRNKVIGLREVLRQGENAVIKYMVDFDLPALPELLPGVQENEKNTRMTGWSGDRCVYFDAIELLDHYITLDKNGDAK